MKGYCLKNRLRNPNPDDGSLNIYTNTSLKKSEYKKKMLGFHFIKETKKLLDFWDPNQRLFCPNYPKQISLGHNLKYVLKIYISVKDSTWFLNIIWSNLYTVLVLNTGQNYLMIILTTILIKLDKIYWTSSTWSVVDVGLAPVQLDLYQLYNLHVLVFLKKNRLFVINSYFKGEFTKFRLRYIASTFVHSYY